MAVIKQLLLSEGGGITSLYQQANQSDDIATVLIGLGGTGIDALRTIKTEVYSCIKPDDPNAIVPTYQHIQFLGIDSDIHSIRYSTRDDALLCLDEEEFLFIRDSLLNLKLQQPELLNELEYLEWFRHENIWVPMVEDVKLGGIRQMGRYLFMNKSQDFINILREKIHLAREGRQNSPLYIHLFAGLSGGTGSGAFLDACYLIKHFAPDAIILGYFFLPDVNLAKITGDNISVNDYLKKNGYAALQELDYCMQLGKNGGQLSQLYPGDIGRVEWNGAPVNICHIIGVEYVQNPYKHAMNVTAEFVMNLLTEAQGNNYALSQHLTAVPTMINISNNSKEIASEVSYAFIGACYANIPNKEINTYLVSKLFSRLTNVQENVATYSEVESIAISALAPEGKTVNKIYDCLLRELKKGAGNDYEPTPLDWKYLREFGDKEIFSYYATQRNEKIRQLDTNYRALDEMNENSLIQRVTHIVNRLVLEKGPNYVFKVLDENHPVNILNIIDGLIAENKARWDLELQLTARLEQERNDMYAELQAKFGRVFFSKELLYQRYLKAIVYYNIHIVDLEAYQRMDALLHRLRYKVDELARRFYKFVELFRDLIETFRYNEDYLRTRNRCDNNLNLVNLNEIRQDLDDRVHNINLDGFMSHFMSYLMNHEDMWITRDSMKKTKLVKDYFMQHVFTDFASYTMTDYLQLKYQTNNQNVISNRLLVEWILRLAELAQPKFLENLEVKWKVSGLSETRFIFTPQTCNTAQQAANTYAFQNGTHSVLSQQCDRISMINYVCGIPLCIFASIEELEERQFNRSYEYGLHLYEGKVYPRNQGSHSFYNPWNHWDQLPPITPISIIGENRLARMVRLKERIDSIKELFVTAIKEGIININDWYLYDYNSTIKHQGIEMIKEVSIMLPNIYSLKDIQTYHVEETIKKLETILNSELEKTNDCLPIDGNDHGIQQLRYQIMFEHFVYFPVYIQKVKGIVELKESIKSLHEQLTKITMNFK